MENNKICKDDKCIITTENISVRTKDGIWFIGSYKDALNKASKENKIVMIDLYADWCMPCRMLKDVVFADGKVKAILNDFICLSLDAETGEGAEIAEEIELKAYPTVIFIKPEGGEAVEIDKFVGNKSIEDVINILTAVRTGVPYAQYLSDQLKKDPDNIHILFKAGMAVRDEDKEKAEEYFQMIVDLDPDDKKVFTDRAAWQIVELYSPDDEDSLSEIYESKLKDFITNYPKSHFSEIAYLKLVEILDIKNEFRKVIETCKEMITKYPESAYLYARFAEYLWFHGIAIHEAVRLAERSVELDGKSIDGLRVLYICYHYSGQDDKCLDVCKRLLEIDEDYLPAKLMIKKIVETRDLF